jgi:outer membrane biosynthesis protein TonB
MMIRVLMLVVLAIFSASCASTAQQSITNTGPCWQEAEPAALKFEPGSGITPPRPVHRAEPILHVRPAQEAEATIEAVIGEDGRPRHICITSGNPDWGRAVAAAFRQWVFEPATLDGKPVAVQFTLTTRFRR